MQPMPMFEQQSPETDEHKKTSTRVRAAGALLAAGLTASTPQATSAQEHDALEPDQPTTERPFEEQDPVLEQLEGVLEQVDAAQAAEALRSGQGSVLLGEMMDAYAKDSGREVDPEVIVVLDHLFKTHDAEHIENVFALIRQHIAPESASESVRENTLAYQFGHLLAEGDDPYKRLLAIMRLAEHAPDELAEFSTTLEALRTAGYAKTIPIEQFDPRFLKHLADEQERAVFVDLETLPNFRTWYKELEHEGQLAKLYTQAPTQTRAEYLLWATMQPKE